MLFKWAIAGAICGALYAVFTDISDLLLGIVAGAVLFVVFRKWVFRTFWG